AKGKIAAAISDKGLRPGKEIQKPLVKSRAEIAVLVPVRSEPGKVVSPVGWNAYRLIVESGAGRGIKRPGEPITKKDGAECGPPPFGRLEAEQKKEWISEPD